MAAIYAVVRDETSGALTAKMTWESGKAPSPIAPDNTDFCSFSVFGTTLLIGVSPERKQLDVYEVSDGGTAIERKGQLDVKLAYDTVSCFSVGGRPHVVAYEPKTGTFDFFRVTETLSLESIYSYSRSYGLVTTGYTTVHAYEYQGKMFLVAYNTGNGDVKIYQLEVTAEEPLSMDCVWAHTWSPGWVRFSFFKMGKENFFLKSNVRHKTVYIDHLNDDATTGSRPVGRNLPLPLDLDIVQTFSLSGCIYFMAYRQTGEIVVNRLHTDCQGWTEELTFAAMEHAICASPFSQGDAQFLFLY